jgi:hypothetical protein
LFLNKFINFKKDGLGHTKSNIVLFITIDKFDPNPILININKLKPYKFIEDITLQDVLVNLSDMVIDELVGRCGFNSSIIIVTTYLHYKYTFIHNYTLILNTHIFIVH